MTQKVQSYLAIRRAMHFTLRSSGEELLLFARHVDSLGLQEIPSVDFVLDWCTSAPNGSHRYAYIRLSALRPFLKHLAVTEPLTPVPSPKAMGRPGMRRQIHIYSDEEVVRLLAATACLTPTRGLRPLTYYTLFGLLASTGMRIGEALAAQRDDVDFVRATFTIRKDKTSSGRVLPLHQDALAALEAYVRRRDVHHKRRKSNALFLTQNKGTGLTYQWVTLAFRGLRRHLGWNALAPVPRIHDLRHTFAVRHLLDWVHRGEDVEARLPALSAYMGHKNPHSTYWYFSAVPALLSATAGRFHRYARHPAAEMAETVDAEEAA
ncbi:tyrosine-type recombinase/integrase [Myxococcus sp. Y35]|uniref:tyrosine-type recombinase/integrase n=1 Tax=Pseudomyxococcus flavus TaxID=3115648 RepID=UPI003CF53CF4